MDGVWRVVGGGWRVRGDGVQVECVEREGGGFEGRREGTFLRDNPASETKNVNDTNHTFLTHATFFITC